MMTLLLILVLAGYLGIELINKVPSQLHTPLMSGSNAISGITIVGAILAGATEGTTSTILALVALFAATVNVTGGYIVTHRMLSMFGGSKPKAGENG